MDYVSDLLHRAKDQRPQFRELQVLLVVEGCLTGTESLVIDVLEETSIRGHDRLRMGYSVLKKGIRTPEPYFIEHTKIRNPGRDF
jgi:hypothetical protein